MPKFVALSVICALSLNAAQVTLKNGDRLSGTVVKSDAKSLLLKSEFAGDVNIQWDAVTAIESETPLNLTLNDGQLLVGPVSTRESNFTVETKTAGTITAAKSNVTAVRSPEEQKSYEEEVERLRNPGILDLWTGVLDAGYATSRGSSDTNTFTAGFAATRATTRDKVDVDLAAIYASNKTTGVSLTTAQAVRGGIRYDLNLSPRWFVFVAEGLEYDKFQKLDLRSVTSGGFGYHLWKQEKNSFDIFGGGAFNREFFSGGIDRSSGEFLVGEELNYQVSKITLIKERGIFFPNLTDTGEFRINFDTSAITTLNRWLAWNVTLSDRYLSDPVPGAKNNDLLFTTGLRFTFAKR